MFPKCQALTRISSTCKRAVEGLLNIENTFGLLIFLLHLQKGPFYSLSTVLKLNDLL